MSTWYLGAEFDIHGGGLDLQFPHHENEQAQSHAAGDGFAHYWMHNHWVTMAGEKMSKSLGNVLSIDNMLEDVRPVELRYYLGSAHYRSVLEYSPAALQEAAVAYRRIEDLISRTSRSGLVERGTWTDGFAAAMNEDFAVPKALAEIHNTVRAANKALADGDAGTARELAGSVRAMTAVLGVDPVEWADRAGTAGAAGAGGAGAAGGAAAGDSAGAAAALDVLVTAELERRAQARAEKDWATADEVRERLTAAGIEVTDTADGATWELKGN